MQELDACLEDVKDIDASNLLGIKEGEKLLLLGGKVHRGSFIFVVNKDPYLVEGTKIGA